MLNSSWDETYQSIGGQQILKTILAGYKALNLHVTVIVSWFQLSGLRIIIPPLLSHIN